MKITVKKILVGLSVLLALVLYPLTSNSKTNLNSNTVVLSDDNLAILNVEVTPDSVAQTIMKLKRLDEQSSKHGKTKPIYLFLYTPGGDIQSGLELIEAVRGLKHPVNTVTLFAASMGFQIAQNMSDRLILKNGILMSHRANGEFGGYFGGKPPSQMDNRYNFWLKRIDELDEQTVLRTKGKQTMESYRNQYQNEMWITGQEAVDQGYADNIVTVRCDSSLDGVDTHNASFLGVDLLYDTSKCPLITGILNIRVADPNNSVQKTSPILLEEIKAKFADQFNFEKNIQ